MTRLSKDVRGNTMAIMAAALIPLAGMVGGGVDIARLYIVKTRLQHACDAGALAGRKAMGGGTWAQTVNGTANYPNVAAQKFFDANYQSDAYGASGLTRTFTENAGKVSGTASATLPMTLMKIFGRSSETLTVTCDAEMRLPNTDVMFVLDTTGSMGDIPVGDTVTKMASLKSSVKCFYEIVARLDTDENCTTGTPSGGTGDQVQIRFGFMPYATNVNVGKLLPTSYFANSWPYQSREAEWTTSTSYTYPNPAVDSAGSGGSGTSGWGSWSNVSNSYGSCPSLPADQNNVTGAYSEDSSVSTDGSGVKTWTTKTYSKYNIDYQTTGWWPCYLQKRYQGTGTYTTVNHTQTPVTVTNQTFNRWHYGKITTDISGLKNGAAWNNSFTLPINSSGTSKTITWDGCIEERATVKQASYSPIPSGAKDLDIDLTPSQSDSTTLWAPALDDLIYTRNDPGGWGGGSGYWTLTDQYTTSNYVNGSQYYCPTQAKKLQQWPDADDFDTYVDSLTPNGNTYHDIGLLWGARFASPTGIFSSENAYTPQGGEIERHIIFMTDGDPCTGIGNYQAYGIAWFDRRETDSATAPTDGCTSTGTITAQVNARTAAICTAIKNKNITLWVITFGTLDSDTVTRMTACATPGRYFNATNAATIQATFKSIADQISQLRLTK
ncbi:Tad domain-containing protein [Sphingomonas sp. LB-2]|uniref:TadE/TadG family type IV pilus assembly protein n=1 Tax=Sphingomonas caeni TaxID=2984949 RepID=UPI002231FFA6|nr:TadE/TadG family type IV pilus assembly protein [Sphingomonas caeni]MCW3849220.1 Tad domain-containing protein [Sphingomonas caeni]